MSVIIRALLIISAVLLLVFMLKRIRQAKLKIEYTIFWISFASLLVFMGIFPKVFYWISSMLGFQSPISMVLLAIIFVLILKMFFMTLQISQLGNKVDALAQQIAIDRKMDLDKDRMKDPVKDLDNDQVRVQKKDQDKKWMKDQDNEQMKDQDNDEKSR